MKTALCRKQKNCKWDLPWYARDPKRFFPPDVQKLVATQEPNRYLLIFAYPAPPTSHWQVMLDHMKRNAVGVCVTLARMNESPGRELSIGWLKVG